MKWGRIIPPVITAAVLTGGALVAYRTQETWMPYVFPTKAEKPAGPADHDDHDDHGHDHGAPAARVKLSPQAQQNLGLDVDTLTARPYWRTVMIPGAVADRPGESDRGVTAKVAGVVAEIRAKPGDTVRAGDPLFTLHLASEFLQSAQAELAKAAREREFAVAKRDRVAEQVRKGTQSGTVLIEEENQVKRFTTQVQAFRRQLQLFGLAPADVDQAEKGEVVTQLTVVAPARASVPASASVASPDLYEVQELKVTLGDQVQAGQSLCVLASHQRLFVEGRAFKSEADALAAAAEKKTPVRAEFADEAAGAWPAQEPLLIQHLSNQVDAATRTFAFYLPLENQSRTFRQGDTTRFVWRYRPGQRVRLRVPVEELVTVAGDGKTKAHPFVLPVGAVVREGPEAFVFVQNGDVFVRKPVRVLFEDRTDVVVANDGSITEADFVVRNQAAALNRALKATADGGGGGHGHDQEH